MPSGRIHDVENSHSTSISPRAAGSRWTELAKSHPDRIELGSGSWREEGIGEDGMAMADRVTAATHSELINRRIIRACIERLPRLILYDRCFCQYGSGAIFLQNNCSAEL